MENRLTTPKLSVIVIKSAVSVHRTANPPPKSRVEQKVQDIAVLDDIAFALCAHFPSLFRGLLAAQTDEIIIGDCFGADKSPLSFKWEA